MSNESAEEQNLHGNAGVRVTLLGMATNLVLFVGKLVVGLLSGSVALVTDGIHSLSDLASDFVVLGGIRLGAMPPDENHPYGHGRFETLAGGVVALILILVGLAACWRAGASLYARELFYPGWPVLVVAMGSICAKEWMYRRTILVAQKENSVALYANAWHHRSDSLSSVAVLLGGIAGLIGWGHADQVAGILVGLMIAGAGGKSLIRVLHELTERALHSDEAEAIKTAIEGVPQVRGWHRLRTRVVGREIFIDLHVLVPPDLTILDAHTVSVQVENAVQAACAHPVNVLVHIEPDTPEFSLHHEDAG
jgi:cation diffusion facilitator family transporter